MLIYVRRTNAHDSTRTCAISKISGQSRSVTPAQFRVLVTHNQIHPVSLRDEEQLKGAPRQFPHRRFAHSPTRRFASTPA